MVASIIDIIAAVWSQLNQFALLILVVGLAFIGVVNYNRLRRLLRNRPPISAEGVPALQATPRISALVPAWNEAEGIEAHIRSFKGLRYPNKELILIAGGSDPTFEAASKYADETVKVIAQQAGKGKQVALRDGVVYATGEIVYLTDADCLFDDDSFERTLAPLINDNYAAATGSSKPIALQFWNPLVAFQFAVNQWALRHAADPSPGLLGRNCAVKTDVLKQTGGFDAPAPTGTDYTLARQLIRHGYTIKNVKQSLIETEFPDALQPYYHKRSRWLRNEIFIGFATGDYRQAVRALRTSVQGGALLIAPFLAPWLGPIWFVLWLCVIAYMAASRVRYIALARYPVPVNKLSVVGAATAILPVDLWIWAASFVQLFNARMRTRWN